MLEKQESFRLLLGEDRQKGVGLLLDVYRHWRVWLLLKDERQKRFRL